MIRIDEDQAVLLEAFKVSLLNEDTSRHTVSAYLIDLAHFLKWYREVFQEFNLDGVAPTDIREYLECLQGQRPPIDPATINRRLAALRRFFRWAKAQQLSTPQPTERIRNAENTELGPKSLDRKQWHRLLRMVEQAKENRGYVIGVLSSYCIIQAYALGN